MLVGNGSMKKSVIGKVVSDKMQKTITVEVPRRVKEPTTGKYVSRHTTCVAHDESEVANRNDLVEIMPTRPMSKHKRWVLLRVVQMAAN